VFSVAIFMIYFCILREENDVDKHLEKSIFESVPGLERSTLLGLYRHNRDNQLDNKDVIKRLLEMNIDPKTID
jgi:hypothetical protein